jgi:hypothetical protein
MARLRPKSTGFAVADGFGETCPLSRGQNLFSFAGLPARLGVLTPGMNTVNGFIRRYARVKVPKMTHIGGIAERLLVGI